MAVLEITLLTVNPSTPPSSPALLSALQTVRTALAAKVFPTRSRFYQNIQTPNEIYILGIWPDLASHHEFLADSALRDEILAPQGGLMDFKWGLHFDLGEAEREDEVSRLLTDARGLEIGRWVVSALKEGEFIAMMERQERDEKRESREFRIAEGWTLEGEGEGGRQFVRVRGWEKLDDIGRGLQGHEGFVEGGLLFLEESDFAEKIEVKVLRNLEEGTSDL